MSANSGPEETAWEACSSCGEVKPVFMRLVEGNAPYCHECGAFRMAIETFPAERPTEPNPAKVREVFKNEDWGGQPPACPLCSKDLSEDSHYFDILTDADPYEPVPAYMVVCEACGELPDVRERIEAIP